MPISANNDTRGSGSVILHTCTQRRDACKGGSSVRVMCVSGGGGTVYPKGGQRVLGWDVRGGHCIRVDSLSCYTATAYTHD